MVPELIRIMASQIEASTTLVARRAVRVLTAELGEWAGAVGAACLVMEETASADLP